MLNINLEDMLLFVLIAFIVACLAQAFQQFLKPGQIFNWYAKWLLSMVEKSTLPWKEEIRHCFNTTTTIHGINIFARIITIFSKPLGLCPYCNGTWIAIFFYSSIYFTMMFNYITVIFLFGFIGTVWFFIKLIEIKLIKEK